MAAIAMFLFKKGSRNAFNNERSESRFKKNFQRTFKVRLPHMDTVDKVMRQLDEGQLERLKTELVSTLIEKKVCNFSISSGRNVNNRVVFDDIPST
jgi:hypothetical protein